MRCREADPWQPLILGGLRRSGVGRVSGNPRDHSPLPEPCSFSVLTFGQHPTSDVVIFDAASSKSPRSGNAFQVPCGALPRRTLPMANRQIVR
jgi:hypothetical protein